MNIQQLREALKISPDNQPIIEMLGTSLLSGNYFKEAESTFQRLLDVSDGIKGHMGLAKAFFGQNKVKQAIVILEELLKKEEKDLEAIRFYAKCLIQEGNLEEARVQYDFLIELDPFFTDGFLENHLKLPSLTEGAEPMAMTEKLSSEISFSDIGGMEGLKKQIGHKIIAPLKFPELYETYGKKFGGGILMFGPPGCGKTFLAKATSGEINAKFISVGLDDVLDMWLGNSEKKLHQVFGNARESAPCILFFDEIDALGTNRSKMQNSGARQLINQFLVELDGSKRSNNGVLVIGATNAPWDVDSAFKRPGRFDRVLFVPPPDTASREEIFKIKLTKKPTKGIDYGKLAKLTTHYSGADIEGVIDQATEAKLDLAIAAGKALPIEMKDLVMILKKSSPSTKEWFQTARNYALFANESGMYNEVLDYLNK